jgi:Flp pilus assembly protein TadD
VSYLLLHEYEKAKASYQKAIALRPDDARSCYGHAVACARLGLREQSEQSMERHQKLGAESMMSRPGGRDAVMVLDTIAYRQILARTCCGAAAVYSGHQRLEKAEELWRRGAAVAPQDTSCRMELALLFLRTKREPEAVRMCQELIKIEPTNHLHHLHLAMIHARLQQFDAARLAAEKAMELAPGNEDCRRTLAELQGRR